MQKTELKIHLCDYGCGQEAKFQFKNGKWCCSKNYVQCPESRRKVGVTSKRRIVSKETRKKMSIARIGKNNGMYGKKHSEETRKKLSIASTGKIHEHT